MAEAGDVSAACLFKHNLHVMEPRSQTLNGQMQMPPSRNFQQAVSHIPRPPCSPVQSNCEVEPGRAVLLPLVQLLQLMTVRSPPADQVPRRQVVQASPPNPAGHLPSITAFKMIRGSRAWRASQRQSAGDSLNVFAQPLCAAESLSALLAALRDAPAATFPYVSSKGHFPNCLPLPRPAPLSFNLSHSLHLVPNPGSALLFCALPCPANPCQF